MPPPPEGVPPIVIGDCRGRTAEAWLSAQAISTARRLGFDSALNEPFAGGHVIERHARPGSGIHALQLEIDRRCYLDAKLTKPGPGFDQVAGLIEALAVDLGQALLGNRYATAAE